MKIEIEEKPVKATEPEIEQLIEEIMSHIADALYNAYAVGSDHIEEAWSAAEQERKNKMRNKRRKQNEKQKKEKSKRV
jgi:uncharacterized protein (DUF2147 family)